MSPALSQQRCLNHAEREAAARCPECERFYCRECTTEHDDRVICANCLRASVEPEEKRSFPFASIGRWGAAMAGFFAAWLFFYLLGGVLADAPDSFHDGSIWSRRWE